MLAFQKSSLILRLLQMQFFTKLLPEGRDEDAALPATEPAQTNSKLHKTNKLQLCGEKQASEHLPASPFPFQICPACIKDPSELPVQKQAATPKPSGVLLNLKQNMTMLLDQPLPSLG